jgi:3'(2'), 5'-bisphosphate nucleotidase
MQDVSDRMDERITGASAGPRVIHRVALAAKAGQTRMPDSTKRLSLDPETADRLTLLVAQAGERILAVRGSDLRVRRKDDASPVTIADEAANALVLDGLARLLPQVPVVSEESANGLPADRLRDVFALVDPLDGTKEFLSGSDEFTVNLAIIQHGQPVAGFVGIPAQRLVFRGIAGRPAERLRFADGSEAVPPAHPIRTRARPQNGLVAAISRSHLDRQTEAFLDRLSVADRYPCGSALKFCRIAEGVADVYPRLSTTCEWDIAAGHALVVAAGGVVTKPDGAPLDYGHAEAGFRVPAFIAWGDPKGAAKE